MLIEVDNHDGSPRHCEDVFFTRPAPGIGRLLSASTSVGPSPSPRGDQTGAVLLAAFLGLVGGMAGARLLGQTDSTWSPLMLVAGAPIFIVTLLLLRRRPRLCTFLGSDGVAIARSRFGLVRMVEHRFQGAAKVEVAFTRGFERGYRATAYRYHWVDPHGRTLFSLAGSFREYHIDREDLDEASIRALPPDDLLHLARAARRVFEFRPE